MLWSINLIQVFLPFFFSDKEIHVNNYRLNVNMADYSVGLG